MTEAPTPTDFKIGPWRIYLDPPPIGTRSCDWHYIHDDYDGPESPAWMTGHCASREACIADIMEGYEDRASRLTPWGWLCGDQKLPGTYSVRTVKDRDDAIARGSPVARLYLET